MRKKPVTDKTKIKKPYRPLSRDDLLGIAVFESWVILILLHELTKWPLWIFVIAGGVIILWALKQGIEGDEE